MDNKHETPAIEEEEEELIKCEWCGRDNNCFVDLIGSCSKCSIENMCNCCGYFNERECEWYCEGCRDKAVDAGEWNGSDEEESDEEESDEEETTECERCGRNCSSNCDAWLFIRGSCCMSNCNKTVCNLCSYYDGDSWYCEDCRDILVDKNEWVEGM